MNGSDGLHIQKYAQELKAKLEAKRGNPRPADPSLEEDQPEEYHPPADQHQQGWGLCRPDCPLCNGTGYIRLDVPLFDPKFGKLEPCPNISVWALVGSVSGLTAGEIGLTWDNLLITGAAIKQAKDTANQIIDRGYGWLTLWGEYGSAKTHILKTITALVLQSRKQAIYVRMSDLLDDLRAAFDTDSPSQEAIRRLDFYSEVYCLAIDEFDRINKTPWAGERTFSLSDKRYELGIRRKGITILAMNPDPAQLDGYLADRIFDGRFSVIRFTNRSLRPGLDWENQEQIYGDAYK